MSPRDWLERTFQFVGLDRAYHSFIQRPSSHCEAAEEVRKAKRPRVDPFGTSDTTKPPEPTTDASGDAKPHFDPSGTEAAPITVSDDIALPPVLSSPFSTDHAQPKPRRPDPRLAAFHYRKAPQNTSVWAPAVPTRGRDAPCAARAKRKKSILEEVEEARWRHMQWHARLKSREAGLMEEHQFEAADQLRRGRKRARQELGDTDLLDVSWMGASTPTRPGLGTATAPLSDPLGLSLFADELSPASARGGAPLGALLFAAPADESLFADKPLTEPSAFRAPAKGLVPAAQHRLRLLELRQEGAQHKARGMSLSREAEVLFEKERLLKKRIYKLLEVESQRLVDEREFVRNTFRDMLTARIRSVCQKLLPQVCMAYTGVV